MKEQKPFISHRGVTIYETFKGRETSSYWFSLAPRQNEDSDQKFDIRRIPNAYRSGLMINYRDKYGAFDTSSKDDVARFFKVLEEERHAHKVALQRAIDDGYSFSSAARENYNQYFRRLFRYAHRHFAKPSAG